MDTHKVIVQNEDTGPQLNASNTATHQQTVYIFRAANEGSEGSQLVCEGQQHLVLIVDGVGEDGDEFAVGPLHAQRQGDGAQLLDGVEPQLWTQHTVLGW